MKQLSRLTLILLMVSSLSCSKSFDYSSYTVAEVGNASNDYISSLEQGGFSFKTKYKVDPEYYKKQQLDSVKIFVFSMSYQGKDPLEFLAADQQKFKESLERSAFNKEHVFGAIAETGDTLYPLTVSAPRTYGMDGQFSSLLSFHVSIDKNKPIRLFYRDKNIVNTPVLFEFKN